MNFKKHNNAITRGEGIHYYLGNNTNEVVKCLSVGKLKQNGIPKHKLNLVHNQT